LKHGRRACVAALAFGALVAASCHPDKTADEQPPQKRTVPVQGWSPEGGQATDAGRTATARDAAVDARAAPATFATAKVMSGKSIGHTSVVLKLSLEGDLTAAWKPRTTRGPWRYKGEIAAYRLATAMGLPNVPLAMPRSFPLQDVLKAVGGRSVDTVALLSKEAIADDQGLVPGALIPWIPHLSFLALEADPLLSEWKGWLAGTAEIPEGKRSLASQVSTMIVFDYLTGNWDRWSGGNVGVGDDKDLVLFIDNDGAFYEKPPVNPLLTQRARLEGDNRFSQHLVATLGRLDDAALRAAFGDDAPGEPLLSDKARAGVRARLDDARKLIADKVKKLGEKAVLAFD
jgi:hypothetical protein